MKTLLVLAPSIGFVVYVANLMLTSLAPQLCTLAQAAQQVCK